MSRHTQGPWVFSSDEEIVAADGTHVVCFGHGRGEYGGIDASFATPYGDAQDDERKANGNLIAAAPDLLAVARCLLSCEDENDLGVFAASVENVIAMAKLAIAKAEGK